MRPGQNRRVRGRNRNKGPNPLTRTFESNGPDVKIRGTAQHVADKYAQLARDAQASGDPVSAENYLQHAEHYYRLIATAQEQLRQQYPGTYGRQFDEDGEEGDDDTMPANGYGYPAGANGDDDGEGGYPGQPPVYEGRNGGDNRFSSEGRQAPVEPRQNAAPAPRYDNNRPNDRQPDRGQQQRFDRNGERYDRNNGQGGTNGYDRNGERYDRTGGPQNQQAAGPSSQQGERYDRQEPRQEQPRQDSRQDPRQEQPRQDGRQEPRQNGRERFAGNRDGRRDYNRNDRPQGERPQGERPQGDRPQGERPYGDRQPERFGRERPTTQPRQDFADDAGREDVAAAGLPAFLTTPVPVRPPVSASDEASTEPGPSAGYQGEMDGLPFDDPEARPRRRRTRRPIANGGPDEIASAIPDVPID